MSDAATLRLVSITTNFPVSEEAEKALVADCRRILAETAGDVPVDPQCFGVSVNRIGDSLSISAHCKVG